MTARTKQALENMLRSVERDGGVASFAAVGGAITALLRVGELSPSDAADWYERLLRTPALTGGAAHSAATASAPRQHATAVPERVEIGFAAAARRALRLAAAEALRGGRSAIDTGDLLVGLAEVGDELARILGRRSAGPEAARAAAEHARRGGDLPIEEMPVNRLTSARFTRRGPARGIGRAGP